MNEEDLNKLNPPAPNFPPPAGSIQPTGYTGTTEEQLAQLENDFVNHKHRYYDKTPLLILTENEISLSDVTTDDVTSTKHGFAPKSPADATKFLNGGATPGWSVPVGHFDYQEFTASGTWNNPGAGSNHAMVYIQLWGGGGAGGAANNVLTSGGGGGGGAEYVEIMFRASDLTSTVSVTIAGAAAGGTNVAANGADGANSTFGTYLTARGGKGGEGSSVAGQNGGLGAGYFPGDASAGGDGIAKDTFSGGGGGNGNTGGFVGSAFKGGGGGAGGVTGNSGGTSKLGGAGGDSHAGNSDGDPGFAPGGGGAGATRIVGTTTQNGGNGGRGECRVWTFFV